MTHPNAGVVNDAYNAFAAGDIEAVAKFLADDTVWHITGSGVLDGDYKGPDQVLGFLGRLMEETGGTWRSDVHDVVANDEHAVALVTVTASRGGQSLTTNQSAVFHLRSGQTTEAWFHYPDGAAVAGLFA